MTVIRDVHAEARAVLSTATVGTHRPLVAWAVGVTQCSVTDLAAYWRTGRPGELCPGEASGQSLDRGRSLDFWRNRVEIRDGDLPRRLVFTWQDVAQVLATGRVTSRLIDECHAAVWERFRHRKDLEPYGDGWCDFDGQCDAAELAAWEACRPVDQGEQLSLFDDLFV